MSASAQAPAQNHRDELRKQAQNALNAGMAREKAGECPDAATTRAQEECLSSEIQKTRANYVAFTGAIRAMLALYPATPAPTGPSGTPLTSSELVAEFDKVEAESKAYRENAAKAAYDQYKGGTLAPVFEAEAELKLLRLHLQELAFIYGEELSNH